MGRAQHSHPHAALAHDDPDSLADLDSSLADVLHLLEMALEGIGTLAARTDFSKSPTELSEKIERVRSRLLFARRNVALLKGSQDE